MGTEKRKVKFRDLIIHKQMPRAKKKTKHHAAKREQYHRFLAENARSYQMTKEHSASRRVFLEQLTKEACKKFVFVRPIGLKKRGPVNFLDSELMVEQMSNCDVRRTLANNLLQFKIDTTPAQQSNMQTLR